MHNFDYWFQSANEFWRGANYYAARSLGPHAAFSLHQAAERYFHAVLLVFTGYKPKSHDIEALAKQTAPFHDALPGALPRIEPRDKHHFSLLKRAYIDARYSKSYRVTSDELVTMREHVLDLGERTRTACADKLRALSPSGERPSLVAVPAIGESVELPELPDLNDARAVETWRDTVAEMSYERGREEGRRDGFMAGVERGREEGRRDGFSEGRADERAHAIVEVLRRRGLSLSDEQVQRIMECRDEATLARWWESAWGVTAVEQMWEHGS